MIELAVVSEDLSTVLLDLNALSATPPAAAGFQAESLELGAPGKAIEWLSQPAYAGAIPSAVRDEVVEWGAVLRVVSATSAGAAGLLYSFFRFLSRGCVIRFRLSADLEYRYMEVYPSPDPTVVDDEEGFSRLAEQYADAGALITVRAWRHPYFLGALVGRDGTEAGLGASANVTNGVGSRGVRITNPGAKPSLLSLTFTPSAGNLGFLRYGLRSHADAAVVDALAAVCSWEAEGGAGGVNSASAPVAGMSGGSVLEITFATDASLRKRRRYTLLPADPRALAGSFRLYAYMTVAGYTAGNKPEVRVQGRYGTADVDPVAVAMEPVPLDFGDVDTPALVPIDLGVVTVGDPDGPGAAALYVELWAERISGDGSLRVDSFLLLPIGETFGTLSSPGLRWGEWGAEVWTPDEILGTGDLWHDVYRLNANAEEGRTPNLPLPAGTYIAEFRGAVREPTKARRTTGFLEILHDGGTGTWTVQKSKRLRSRKNRRWRVWGRRTPKRIVFRVTDVTAAYSWRIRVRYDDPTLNGRRIQVARLSLSSIRAFTTAQPAVVDARDRVAEVRAGVDPLFPLMLEGDVVVTAPPGESLLVVDSGDVPTDPGFEDLDDRESLPVSVPARIVGVVVDQRTRYPF